MGRLFWLLILSAAVHAGGPTSYRCVGAYGAHAPSLVALESPLTDLKAPILIGDRYEYRVDLKESDVIALLLDSTDVFVSNPRRPASVTKKGLLRTFCKQQASEQELQQWMSKHPEWFVDVSAISSGNTLLRLRDVKHRYFKSNEHVLAPGWIDGAEVRSVETQGRTYLRMNHPVTHRLRTVLVLNKKGVPVGSLLPSREPGDLEWSSLWRFSTSYTARKRRQETYLYLMEEAAYAALLEHPEQTEQIRRVQEFYRNLLRAYELYPDSKQFLTYQDPSDQRRALASRRSEIEAEFDETFFEAIRDARIQDSYARFSAFEPDSKLYRIYLEFRSRLQF